MRYSQLWVSLLEQSIALLKTALRSKTLRSSSDERRACQLGREPCLSVDPRSIGGDVPLQHIDPTYSSEGCSVRMEGYLGCEVVELRQGSFKGKHSL
jgi:hypothetical protein